MENIIEYVKGISIGQYSSLIAAIFLFVAVKHVALKVLSFALSFVGILLFVYFLYPEGYSHLSEVITRTVDFVGNGGGDRIVENVKSGNLSN